MRRSVIVWLCIASLVCPATLAVAADAAVADRLALPESDEGLPGEGPLRRYDWFSKLWRTRREQWSKTAEKDRGAVVFLGDSITQGWGDDFQGR